MTSHPSPAETQATCERLFSPRPRCHYCSTRAETPGQFAALSAGWDTRPGPAGVAWWRCASCRAEDEGGRKVLVVPVRVEAACEWCSTAALCAYAVALLLGVAVLARLLEELPPGIAAAGAAVGTVVVVLGVFGRRGR